MGAAATRIIDPVRVPKTQGKYPPPLAPKWFLPDIRPLVSAPEVLGRDSRNLDWDGLARSLQNVEEGVSTDVVRTRPSSGIGTSRTDSGYTAILMRRHKEILSFTAIDNQAKAALPPVALTFEALLKYLKQQITHDTYPQTCLVRAVTVWFSKQNTTKTPYQHADVTTPKGIIQHLRQQTLTFTEAYALLCRGVEIPTVIIRGVVKFGNYQPGDVIDSEARDTWCAVYVDGSWQLVHPLWVCRGTYGKEKDGLVQIEDDALLADNVAKRQKQEKDILIFNEEFFMPKPEVFIYRCYAIDRQWHLIPEEKTIKSVDEFTKLAYISPSFFKFGFQLASNPFCLQSSVNGTVILEIIAPKDHVHAVNVGYFIEVEEVEKHAYSPYKYLLEKSILSRFVINYRCNDRFVFEIRLPVEGNYHFVVTGGFGDELCNLCRFKLICTETLGEWFISPVHPGPDCWGPGPMAEKAGLLLPSNPCGLLVTQSRPQSGVRRNTSVFYHLATLSFQINRTLIRKFEYTVEILMSAFVDQRKIESQFMPNGELKADIGLSQKKSKSGEELPVRAQFAKDFGQRKFTVNVVGNLVGEECVVLIKATEMEIMNNVRIPKKNTTKVICYYLLSNANSFFSREPTQVKLSKTTLQEAMSSNNANQIQNAMDKCLKFRIPITDDAVAAAESRLEYLRLMEAIVDCVKRRNIAILNDTLARVLVYRYREAMVVEVEKLLELRQELHELHGFTQKLPSLRASLEELYKLAAPTKPVHNTMKALLLLLGLDQGNLKDWKYIRSRLKVTMDRPQDMVLVKRMEYMSERNFPWHNMDITVLQKVYKTLHSYPFEQVKYVSMAAATIYNWVDAMMFRAKQAIRG